MREDLDQEVRAVRQFRITWSERSRYHGTTQVPVTFDRVGPDRWTITVKKQRKVGTVRDGYVGYQVDLARYEGRYVGQEPLEEGAPA